MSLREVTTTEAYAKAFHEKQSVAIPETANLLGRIYCQEIVAPGRSSEVHGFFSI